MKKVRPTKVTKEDVDLADEISRVTTIKALVAGFVAKIEIEFKDLIALVEGGNLVPVYRRLLNSQAGFLKEAQTLQAKLLENVGQVGEEDAHELADPETEAAAIVGSMAEELDTELADTEGSENSDNSEPLDIPASFNVQIPEPLRWKMED